MNIKLIKFLIVLSGILIIAIFGEWLYATHAKKELIASIEKVDRQQAPIAQLPTLELTKQPESSFVNLVNRPLFIQGRRPVNEAPPIVVSSSKASETFNWSLNGIYTNKKTLYALMTRTSGKVAKDNYRKVTKHNEIDGWIISEIHKDKVVVAQGDKIQELPLRKPKPKKNTPINPNSPPQNIPPVGVEPGQQPLVPGQMPVPEGAPGEMVEPVPGGTPGIPENGQPVPEPVPEIIPEAIPEPMLDQEAPLEPEIIPEDPSDIYIENNDNVQLQ